MNIIERLIATTKGTIIKLEDIRKHLNIKQNQGNEFNFMFRENEIKEIKEALIMCRGNQTEAARVLGISRIF